MSSAPWAASKEPATGAEFIGEGAGSRSNGFVYVFLCFAASSDFQRVFGFYFLVGSMALLFFDEADCQLWHLWFFGDLSGPFGVAEQTVVGGPADGVVVIGLWVRSVLEKELAGLKVSVHCGCEYRVVVLGVDVRAVSLFPGRQFFVLFPVFSFSRGVRCLRP